MILVEGAIRIKEPYPTITALTAIIIVTEDIDDLTELPGRCIFILLLKLSRAEQWRFVMTWWPDWKSEALSATLRSHQRRSVPPSSPFSQQDIWFLL